MVVNDRHEHAGHSSAEGIDVAKVLREVGVKEGMIVLDLGCGKGDYSIGAASIVGPLGRVYALDTHSESLMELTDRMNESSYDNIRIIRSDMTKGIPLSENEAEVVLIFNVLHGLVHNEEEEKPLREISRIVNVGGILAIMEPIPGRDGRGPPDHVRLSSQRIGEILMPYGFQTARSFEVVTDRDLIIMTKKG